MRKIYSVMLIIASLMSLQVYADDTQSMPMDSSGDKPCLMIAKACVAAGYVIKDSTNKRFWQNCMKPILLGNTVSGVKVDAAMAKTCRAHKIQEMKMELKELQSVK